MNFFIILGIIIPFIGTTLGSSLVFFFKNNINNKLEKFLLGFAAGVMIAASIWSLIIPSINLSSSLGKLNFLPAAIGISTGMLFLLLLDIYINKTNIKNKKTNLLYLAVTMHNIPEGMAVGAGFLSYFINHSKLSLLSGLILSIGIAVQNFPEGAIISLPLKSNGYTKTKSFLYGMISGIVEPIFAIITILLAGILLPTLPYLMSFAAGAMIYVVIEELIPESSHYKTLGVMLGFLVMMILDVVLS